MGWFHRLHAWVLMQLGARPDAGGRIAGSILVLVAYVIATRVARRIAARAVEDATSRYQISKASGYVLGLAATGLLVWIWLEGLTGFATYLGLLSAGIAVALQEPIIDVAGWIFLIIRRPFRVGDRIQIGPHSGDVVDIRVLQFTLLEVGNWVNADQSTGRVIHIPNGWLFKNSIANYDQGFRFIWNEIDVVVTFESDWRKAKAALQRIVTDHAEHHSADATADIDEVADRYHIKFSKLTPYVWTSVVDHGVRLTMRYLCKPRDRRSSTHELWEEILTAFEQLPDVDLAYPTTRRFDNAREGKPGAGGPARGAGAKAGADAGPGADADPGPGA
ncbi:MAG: mechanosensitive ion channel [Polyangiaceae bacterium]|nr:mechanosensitive ion channel [Polyangiaceae bacterium]